MPRKLIYRKAVREAATKMFAEILSERKALAGGRWRPSIETAAGTLFVGLSIDDHAVTIHCQFGDVDRAWAFFEGDRRPHHRGHVNPFSGKYNHYLMAEGFAQIDPKQPQTTDQEILDQIRLCVNMHLDLYKAKAA